MNRFILMILTITIFSLFSCDGSKGKEDKQTPYPYSKPLVDYSKYDFVESLESSPVRSINLEARIKEFQPVLSEADKAIDEKVQSQIGDVVKAVLEAIRNNDFKTLAKYIHPEYGLMFCAYKVDPKTDLILSVEQLRTFGADIKVYKWNNYHQASTGGPNYEFLIETKRDFFKQYWFDYKAQGKKLFWGDWVKTMLWERSILEKTPKYFDNANNTSGFDRLFPYIFNNHLTVACSWGGELSWYSRELFFIEYKNDWKLVCVYKNDYWGGRGM